MSKQLIILLLIELGLAVALALSGEIHRSETRLAFAEWRENPTKENREAFMHEKQIGNIQMWCISGAFFAALAMPTVFFCRRKCSINSSHNRKSTSGIRQ